jgi:hypothetical protein
VNHFYAECSEAGLALLTILLFTLGALAILWLWERLAPAIRFERGSSDFGQIYGGAIGTIFALIYAFVIIAVWQNYDRVSAAVGQETNVLHNIYRNLDGYPAALGEPAKADLRVYLEEVIHVEWPLLAEGRPDPAAHLRITEFNRRLTCYRPEAQAGLPLHGQMLELMNQYRSLRQDRIKGAEAYLDPSMWISLALGSVILLLFSTLLNMASRRQHYLMHGALGASMGLVFFLLFVYNCPFLGPGAISPAPMRALAEDFRVPE